MAQSEGARFHLEKIRACGAEMSREQLFTIARLKVARWMKRLIIVTQGNSSNRDIMKIENEIDPTETSHRFRELQQQVGEKARNVSRVTDEFVHENTWTTVAVAAVIGCLIGYFLRPRD